MSGRPDAESSFLEIASRIDDGKPVDWARAEQEAEDAEGREVVGALRVLSDVAEMFRDPDRVAAAHQSASIVDDQAGIEWGPLAVREIVGRGAFGTVHRAVDALGRDVAVKLLDPGTDVASLKARIFEEGRLLARLHHPNIVVVHGAGEYDGRVGLWMEFLDGRTLDVEVKANGCLGADDAAVIGRRLCGALAAVHGAGLIHADVKAQNVMRQRGGRIVLMDFGAGQTVVDAGAHRLAGTPLYLAPERLAGGPPTTGGDIYALGVLLYYLVTAAYPFDGATREEVERAHREGRRTHLRDRRSDLPDGFVTAVEDAIAVDPARRHATAGAFDDALARVVAPLPAVVPGPRRSGLHGWWRPVLAAAMLALSVIGIKWMVERLPEAAAVAPVAAGATPPVSPAEAPYTARVVFYEVGEKARRAMAQRARVTVDDAIELEIELSRSAHVYVVNEDDAGEATLLFPLPEGGARNPLAAGTHLLPGPIGSEARQWGVSSHGGREHFFVMVSPTPAPPEIAAAVARLPVAAESRLAEALPAPGGPGGLRGVKGITHRRPPAPTVTVDANAPWRRHARPLGDIAEHTQGLWVRQLTLENPPGQR